MSPSTPRSCSTRAHRWIIGYICHELRNPLHVLKSTLSSMIEMSRGRVAVVAGANTPRTLGDVVAHQNVDGSSPEPGGSALAQGSAPETSASTASTYVVRICGCPRLWRVCPSAGHVALCNCALGVGFFDLCLPLLLCVCSSSSSHAGFINSSTLHLLAELEDPHQRMVATDAVSAIDRMECTVNDVCAGC